VIRAVRAPIVRVNSPATRWLEDDLALVRELDLAAVVLPKATPEAVATPGAEGPPVRAMGYRGKSCIHPAQVPVVNRVFAPSEAEVVWARDVVEAWEREAANERGVFALNGAMVDLPVHERARGILSEAGRSETQ